MWKLLMLAAAILPLLAACVFVHFMDILTELKLHLMGVFGLLEKGTVSSSAGSGRRSCRSEISANYSQIH
jgi:hypothetical protein